MAEGLLPSPGYSVPSLRNGPDTGHVSSCGAPADNCPCLRSTKDVSSDAPLAQVRNSDPSGAVLELHHRHWSRLSGSHASFLPGQVWYRPTESATKSLLNLPALPPARAMFIRARVRIVITDFITWRCLFLGGTLELGGPVQQLHDTGRDWPFQNQHSFMRG